MKGGFLNIKGNKIYYKIYGQEINDIPLILVHGGPGANHIYLETIAELSDKMPVVFYDQLGCGYSDMPADYSKCNLEYYTEELRSLIRLFGYKKVNLLGSSWGTMPAVNLILKFSVPEVNSLILSGACLDVDLWMNDQRKNLEKLSPGYYEIVHKCEETCDYENEDYVKIIYEYSRTYECRLDPMPELLKESFSDFNYDLYNYMWGPSEISCTGILKNYSILHKLKDIKVPVLYTVGEYDECTPATAEIYKNNTPGSQLVVFPGASHSHHAEKQKEFNDTIRDFLKHKY